MLGVVCAAEEPVVPGEHHADVLADGFPVECMVPLVHERRHQQVLEHAREPQPHVRVDEVVPAGVDGVAGGCRLGLESDQQHRRAGERGVDHLERVKPQRRQDVDLLSAVVHRVKRPQGAEHMLGAVPPIHDQVVQPHGEQDLQPHRQRGQGRQPGSGRPRPDPSVEHDDRGRHRDHLQQQSLMPVQDIEPILAGGDLRTALHARQQQLERQRHDGDCEHVQHRPDELRTEDLKPAPLAFQHLGHRQQQPPQKEQQRKHAGEDERRPGPEEPQHRIETGCRGDSQHRTTSWKPTICPLPAPRHPQRALSHGSFVPFGALRPSFAGLAWCARRLTICA